jgi:hypothetical protein
MTLETPSQKKSQGKVSSGRSDHGRSAYRHAPFRARLRAYQKETAPRMLGPVPNQKSVLLPGGGLTPFVIHPSCA